MIDTEFNINNNTVFSDIPDKATKILSDTEKYTQIINDYNIFIQNKYTNDNVDIFEIIELFNNIFKNFIYQKISLNHETTYINFNFLTTQLIKITDTVDTDENKINNIKKYIEKVAKSGDENINFDNITIYTPDNITDITDIKEDYIKIIEKNPDVNMIVIAEYDFIEKSEDNSFNYNMTDDNYMLYKESYHDIITVNKDALTTIEDFLNKENYTKYPNSDYIRYSSIKTYNNNIPKTFIIQFNLAKDKFIITPAEKLYLNNNKYSENVNNNEKKFLSLQSIIFYSMGESVGKDYKSGHYTCLFKCNNKWYYYNDFPTVTISEYNTLDYVLKNDRFKHLKIRLLYYI
jgi:hypothetical protein